MIKKKVDENTRKAAKTMWLIDYAKSINCISQIRPWQMSVNPESTILGHVSLVIRIDLVRVMHNRSSGRFDKQQLLRHAPFFILKLRVNPGSMIFGFISMVIVK